MIVVADPITSAPEAANVPLKWAGYLLFATILFPAVSFLPLPITTDTQPNALLLAGVIFLLGRNVPIPTPVWSFLVLFICATFLFILEGSTLNGMRSLAGYATVFFVPIAVLILAANGIRLPQKLLDWSVYVWGLVGAVQLFVWPSFMTFLVTASRTTETRGVPALSNEPSLYATTLIFFVILYFIRGKERSLPVLLCLIQIVLFSQSMLGILFVLMILGLYLLYRLSAPTAILASLALIGLIAIVVLNSHTLLAGTRAGGLIQIALNSPLRILQLDQSVAARVANIFYSLKGAIENYLIPHGFNTWSTYSDVQDQVYRGILSNWGGGDRIESGYGAVLFEMGIAGLILPVLITIGAIRTYRQNDLGRAITLLVIVHLLLLTPVTLAFPFTGLVIGELFATRNSKSSITAHKRLT